MSNNRQMRVTGLYSFQKSQHLRQRLHQGRWWLTHSIPVPQQLPLWLLTMRDLGFPLQHLPLYLMRINSGNTRLVGVTCTYALRDRTWAAPSLSIWGESHRIHFPEDRSHLLWETWQQPTNEKLHGAACSRMCPAWPIHSPPKDERM